MIIIEVEGLTKSFGDQVVVNDVRFFVNKGEIFGLLGPNGAGKTTLIRMLSTLLVPDKGKAKIFNFDISKEGKQVRKRILLVRQESVSDPFITGRDLLEFYGKIYGLNKTERSQWINMIIKKFQLEGDIDKLIRECSGGTKRKIMLGKALLINSDCIFLDEPTAGLDPRMRRTFWEFIKEVNRRGTTILLTTHDMQEADTLCDRVALMDKGKIIAIDTPDNLKRKIKGRNIIDVTGQKLRDCKKEIDKLAYVEKAQCKQSQKAEELNMLENLIIYVDDAESRLTEIISLLKKYGATIDSVRVRTPTLEDVFLHYTGRGLD